MVSLNKTLDFLRSYSLAAALSVFMPSFANATMPDCSDLSKQTEQRCAISLDKLNGAGFSNYGRDGPGEGERSKLIVDNNSSYLNVDLEKLVLQANGSTNSVNGSIPGGLMDANDRVCVTDNYLAWFDNSPDTVNFDRNFYIPWNRAGTLAGLWSIDSASGKFRYPNEFGVARNELIVGSATNASERYWWDNNSFPVEHTIVVPNPALPDPNFKFVFLAYPHALKNPKSNFAVLADGLRDGVVVRYASSALMTSWNGSIDAVDDEDKLDVKNSIQASLEYRCTPERVEMLWRFSPQHDIATDNIYVFAWLAYSQDEDNTRCDPAKGNEFPDNYGELPLYVRSSEMIHDTVTASVAPPGSPLRISFNTKPCDKRENGSYDNPSVYTRPESRLSAGSWMDVGYNPDFSRKPVLRFSILETPGIGDGSVGNPNRVDWLNLIAWQENSDGTIGAGVARQGILTTLKGGQWYQSYMSIGPAR